MFKFIDINQNTDEWFQLRCGKLTSSKLGVIMAVNNEYLVVSLGKDTFGIANTKTRSVMKARYTNKIEADGALMKMKSRDLGKAFTDYAKKYAVNIAIEQITGSPISSDYTNADMQRGHDQEPVARMLYEDETFSEVTNGGFWESDFIGCSPDGMVDDNGAIEIKSVITSVHYANVKRGNVDPAYRWQCIGNLKFTGSDWLDFISYCEEFPEGMRLFTYRLNKADLSEEFKMLDDRIELFKTLVDETRENILASTYFN